MKREKIVFIMSLIIMSISSIVSALAVSAYLYNSNEVSYNNNKSGLVSSNVQDAIDELHDEATNYTSLNTRVNALEGKWKNDAKSYFDNKSGYEWLHINGVAAGKDTGVTIYDSNDVRRSDFYYNEGAQETTVAARDSSGAVGTGKLNIRGNPVQINGTNIADYYKVTTTTYSVKTKTALAAHSGNSFNNLLASLPSVTVPSGYTLVSHTHIELSGAIGVYCFFDNNVNATKTSSIGGYIYNASNSNVASGANISINIISLWKKS